MIPKYKECIALLMPENRPAWYLDYEISRSEKKDCLKKKVQRTLLGIKNTLN